MWNRSSACDCRSAVSTSAGDSASRKYKSKISGPFGQRQEALSDGCGDDDLLDAGDGGGSFRSFDGLVEAGFGDGDHHDAGRGGCEMGGGDVVAEGVAEDELFEWEDVSARSEAGQAGRSTPLKRKALAQRPPMGRAWASSIQAPSEL